MTLGIEKETRAPGERTGRGGSPTRAVATSAQSRSARRARARANTRAKPSVREANGSCACKQRKALLDRGAAGKAVETGAQAPVDCSNQA